MPRRFRRAACALALVMLVAGCSPARPASDPPASAPPGPRPNVVLVMPDDLDTPLLRYMPNVRRLLTDQGTAFDRFYTNVPWCCPSRVTALRGQYAHNTGVYSVVPPNGGFVKFHETGEERSTLATWLKQAGYRTGLFGKYLNGFPKQVPELPMTYVPPGWDTWVSPVAGHPFRGYDYTMSVDGKLVRHRPADGDYVTDELGAKAVEFINAPDDRPFFAVVTPLAPHLPAVPARRHSGLFPGVKAPRPPGYDKKDMSGRPVEMRRLPRVSGAEQDEWDRMWRRRAQSVVAIDEMVADLVKVLRAKGELANTYFVFTSDNGFHTGQFRMPPGKNTGYEFDTRVPFIVRGPGVRKGRSTRRISGNTDIAPTIMDLAGGGAPGWVDGRSLRPLLEGRPNRWRAAYLVEHGRWRSRTAVGPGDDPDPYTPENRLDFYLPKLSGIRTSRYLYLEYVTGERELYDMRRDPHMLTNLAAEDPATAARLARWMGTIKGCRGAACERAENSPP